MKSINENRFLRLEAYFGKEKVNDLSKKTILVLGLGGVGGYVVESLARSNIGTLILVDYDTVDITNINRQIIALSSTIGKYKTECFKERIKDINPLCEVICINKLITEENYKELFNYHIDYVADCCDSIKVKESIIKYCLKNNIKIISSMGTGNRQNPEDLEIIDVMKTSGDPIARRIRKYLKDQKINKKLYVMCSREVPKNKIHGVIPSNSFVPPSAGLLISSYIIKTLTKNNKQ